MKSLNRNKIELKLLSSVVSWEGEKGRGEEFIGAREVLE